VHYCYLVQLNKYVIDILTRYCRDSVKDDHDGSKRRCKEKILYDTAFIGSHFDIVDVIYLLSIHNRNTNSKQNSNLADRWQTGNTESETACLMHQY